MRVIFTIFVCLFFLSLHSQTYDPAKAGTALNKGIAVRGLPVDARSYFYDATIFSSRPFNSTAEVLSYFNTSISRIGNFNIYITLGGIRRTYQFRDGTADGNLVVVDNIDATAGVTSVNGLTGVVTFTKNDVSLGNVDNTSDATKNSASVTLTNKILDVATTKYGTTSTTGYVLTAIDNSGHYTSQPTQAIGGTVTTVNGLSGAVTINKSSISLGNVDNTSDANKPLSTADVNALALKADQASLTSHTSNLSNPHQTTATQVGLGSVNNTSDAAKPVSTAQQTALNLKADAASPTFSGTIGGTYTLGGTPTFPAIVTQNAASQTLTNKTISGASNTFSSMGTIGNSPTTTTIPITYTLGTGSTIPAATHSLAGVLTAADKTRLDSNYTIVQPLVTGQVIGYAVDAQTLRLKSIVAGTGITVTNTGDSILTIANASAVSQAEQTLTDGATVTLNCNNGLNAVVTLGGNRTLAITNAVAGNFITLRVVQDGSGSRTLTLPAGSKVITGGAGVVTLSTTAAAQDIISLYYNGSQFFISYGKNFN